MIRSIPSLAVLICVLSTAAATQQAPMSAEDALGLAKLELEVANLERQSGFYWWLEVLFAPIAVAGVIAFFGYRLERRQNQLAAEAKDAADARKALEEVEARRFGALVDERCAAYAKAFAITEATALLFPRRSGEAGPSDREERILTPSICADMGLELSKWYFGPGGLLMSKNARAAYLRLGEALATAAAHEGPLDCQTFAAQGTLIADSQIAPLRRDFKVAETAPRNWSFGIGPEGATNKDFVYIQSLASGFRTRLTEDIASREPPGAAAGAG